MKIFALMHRYVRAHTVELVAFFVTLFIALLAYFGSELRFANDDQFILYRYIDAIATGQGFVFNAGERVLGSTTPLFTLIAAAIKWLFPVIETQNLVAVINASFLALCAPLIFLITRRFATANIAALTTLIFSLNLARAIPEGMETPLFILTLLSFLLFFFKERYASSAVFLALAVLTRPDALLIALLAFVAWWGKLGAWQAFRLSAITGATALPWLLFSVSYFGSALPQSLAAKLQSADIYHLPAFQAVKVQLAHLSRILWGRLFDPANVFLQSVGNLVPFLALAGLGARAVIRGGGWLIPAIPVAYLVSFSLANPVMFPWYLSEMEPLWILLAGVGFMKVLQYVRRPLSITMLVALMIAGPLWAYVSLFSHGEGGKTAYRDAASYIFEHQEGGEDIGLSDIGVVAYRTRMPIIDFIGLVSPDSVAFYPIPDECASGALYVVPLALVRAYEPAWIVASDEQLGPCMLADAWFRERYAQEAVFGTVGVFHRMR